MKNSNWFGIAVLGAALSFGSVASAQVVAPQAQVAAHSQLTPEQKQEKRLAHLSKKLNLTDAQKAQIRSIWAQDKSRIQSERQTVKNEPKGPARKADRKQLQSDRQNMEQQLKNVLTPDQQAKFKAMQDANKQKRAIRRNNRGAAVAPSSQTK